MLPLTFADPADYDKVKPDDKVSLTGVKALAPGSQVKYNLLSNYLAKNKLKKNDFNKNFRLLAR